MNIKDVVQSSEVVAGMLSVNATKAKVLFYSGATRSFISETFANKLKYELEPLIEPLSIHICKVHTNSNVVDPLTKALS